ncbi:MAG TPA: preprotein translocase subunit SecG [Gammaproteobacteria bacterium]|nr:preprotein translocase subunit SecG [Gammaproteobacteria bacterium]
MLFSILVALMVLLGIVLIVLILLHQGKGADAGAQFGSGASGTVFGARGSSSFLTRTISVLMTLFVVLALVMVWISRHGAVQSNSVMASAGSSSTVSRPAASEAGKAGTRALPAAGKTVSTPAASTHGTSRHD